VEPIVELSDLESGSVCLHDRDGKERTMKAIVYHEYGSPAVLKLEDIDKPQVEDNEVLVRVHAASVNRLDWHLMRGTPYIARLQAGLRKPKDSVLGADVAGQVDAVGKHVTTFEPGDKVFGSLFGHGFGAFAEYVSVSDDLLELKPANLSFYQAAAVPVAALTALQGLRDHGRIEPGHKVLIIGASGGVGTFAVQIAKSFGAKVTGVCSTRNVDLVRSLGAEHVIDYTREDFTQREERYDLVFELAGSHSPSEIRRVLTSKGTLVLIGHGGSEGRWIGPFGRMVRALVLSRFVSQRIASFTGKPNYSSGPNPGDLAALKELLETGKVTPVVDGTYSLSETPEAIRYLEEGHARGKVVVTTSDEGA
jgi:NADPH:quinone reductase-like Zn-dependent oxidoreductase